jgi:hypothetical protein
MNNENPPPLPQPSQETARATYGYSIALLIPMMVFFVFAFLVLMPKLNHVWKDADLNVPAMQHMMNALQVFFGGGRWVFGATVMLLVLLESTAAWWPRLRKRVVMAATITINSLMLVAFALISLLSLLIVHGYAMAYHEKQSQKIEKPVSSEQ